MSAIPHVGMRMTQFLPYQLSPRRINSTTPYSCSSTGPIIVSSAYSHGTVLDLGPMVLYTAVLVRYCTEYIHLVVALQGSMVPQVLNLVRIRILPVVSTHSRTRNVLRCL